jgi:N-acetylglucosaminyl-diphospho-decaprenol L-rhamnosyltransferase
MINTTAIIISYNSAIEIGACIDSLLSQQDVNLDIIVVDNASADNSLEVLKGYQDKIKLIASPENLGFGRANNLAASQSNSDFVFLFNPDARLPDEHALSHLIAYLKAHEKVGLVAPKMLDESGQHETLPRYSYPGQKHASVDFSELPGKIAWVIGACMLLPKAVYQDIDGFDEAFFLYGEDADLCLRVRKHGYRIDYLEDISVVHIGGASEKHAASYDKTMRKQKALHHFYGQHYSKQDATYLVLREMRRAKWRMFIYRLAGVFSKNKKARYGHYRAVYDSSKTFLGAMN